MLDMDLKFANPEYLYFLGLIPLVLIWALYDVEKRKSQLKKFAADSMVRRLAPELSFPKRFRKSLLLLISLSFLIVAAARPLGVAEEESIQTSGVDALFILDISRSMDAEDVPPSRLRASKRLIKGLVEKFFPGDRLGIVAFAQSGFMAVPLTTYHEYLDQMLDNLSTSSTSKQGTDIGEGLIRAAETLKRGGVSGDGNGDSAIVYLFTDGEDWGKSLTAGVNALSVLGIKLVVVGVGSLKGSPIAIRDDEGVMRGYKRDLRGETVVSSVRRDYLLDLAQKTNGKYFDFTYDSLLIDALYGEASGIKENSRDGRKVVRRKENYQFPLAIAVLTLVLELCLAGRRIMSERERHLRLSGALR